jgi:SAM-dependent methyltransferase
LKARFLCGDARHLPFRDARFSLVHSYGVFQHFSKDNARLAISEVGRVLGRNGTSLIQMTGAFGPLALWRIVAYPLGLGFRDGGEFKVRHWTPGEIRSTFGLLIGPTTVSVDGYLTIMPQPGDLKLLDLRHRLLVRLSDFGRGLSRTFPALILLADSLYATSQKPSSISGVHDSRIHGQTDGPSSLPSD